MVCSAGKAVRQSECSTGGILRNAAWKHLKTTFVTFRIRTSHITRQPFQIPSSLQLSEQTGSNGNASDFYWRRASFEYWAGTVTFLLEMFCHFHQSWLQFKVCHDHFIIFSSALFAVLLPFNLKWYEFLPASLGELQISIWILILLITHIT
jgi:hypothetical protein